MIQIDNLNFGYRKGSQLFKNLHLTLKRGHIYGLLGKNGAGKSTLLKNMVGLAYPTAGKCLIDGEDASKRAPKVLENLYFLAEEIFVPALSIAKYMYQTAGFYPKFSESHFFQYLTEFDVPREAVLYKLSYGQQKKVMIAFALATNTDLLIMDEPTNGLDIPSKVQFRKIIASAFSEERCIIISTHQVRDLENLIDTLVVLHNRDIVVNQELDQISEKLLFTTVPAAGGYEGALYTEETIRGVNVILPNPAGIYSKVDIELFFNAIMAENQELLQLVNSKNIHHAI